VTRFGRIVAFRANFLHTLGGFWKTAIESQILGHFFCSLKVLISFLLKMDWATSWASFSQANLATVMAENNF
jgi:hypothetical protein